MKTVVRSTVLVAAACATFVLAAPQADAGGFTLSIGTPGFYGGYGGGYQSNFRGYGGYGYGGSGFGYSSYRPSYGYGHAGYGYAGYGHSGYGYGNHGYRSGYGGYHPSYPHLDYHPPAVVPHGNHYDLIPGHYDVHGGHGYYGH